MSVIDLMIPAVWRGVPFQVVASSVRVGRRVAVHEYPFRDQPWVEDMGRAPRVLSFAGRLIGDDVYLKRALMQAACELSGPGLLIHPTLGPVQCSLAEPVALRDSGTAQRVVEFEMTFIVGGDRVYPSLLLDTQSAIRLAVASALLIVGEAVASAVSGSGNYAATVSLGAQNVATAWGNQATIVGSDPAAIAAEASGLTGYNGRFDGGALAVPAAASATVASQQAAVVTSRAAIADAVASLSSAAGSIVTSPDSCSAQARAAIVAIEGAAISPADQIRLLSGLAGFAPATAAGAAPIGAAIAAAQTALGAMLRRQALLGLAEAIAAYQPDSAEDARSVLTMAVDLFDAEIVTAADGGDGAAFGWLRAVRTAIVQDLDTRGAKLAHLRSFAMAASMPAVVLAWRFYQDTGRVRDLISRASAPHPLFMPLQFQALDT